MVRRFTRRAALREPAFRRDIYLAPEDRLDPALPRVIVKDDRRKHVSVFGHRQRGHLHLRRAIEQFVDTAGAVEQRVLSVKMKVDELGHSHSMVDGGLELMS